MSVSLDWPNLMILSQTASQLFILLSYFYLQNYCSLVKRILKPSLNYVGLHLYKNTILLGRESAGITASILLLIYWFFHPRLTQVSSLLHGSGIAVSCHWDDVSLKASYSGFGQWFLYSPERHWCKLEIPPSDYRSDTIAGTVVSEAPSIRTYPGERWHGTCIYPQSQYYIISTLSGQIHVFLLICRFRSQTDLR